MRLRVKVGSQLMDRQRWKRQMTNVTRAWKHGRVVTDQFQQYDDDAAQSNHCVLVYVGEK